MSGTARSRYRAVIVGAGIVGLFTSYHLARAGAGPILVIDRGFLSSGASGRNGGGVRQQWETRSTVRLAREAVAEYRRFPSEFGVNPWFRQGGYLFLAETQEDLLRLRRVHEVVASEGLGSRLLDPAGAARIVPELSQGRIAGASYLASDGTLYPFPAVWGVYERARELGVEFRFGVEALGVVRDGSKVERVETSAGAVGTDAVVDAAGGWSGEFAARCGVPVPNVATRHEILATEPLKPFLDPMVIRLSDGLYVSQTMRGELVGGLTLAHRPGTSEGMSSSAEFLPAMARALVDLFPRIASLGVLRAWSGFYDDTPDGLPVIGGDPRLAGFFHGHGFGGHGFMLAPASSRRIARSVLGERIDLDPAEYGVERFLHGPVPAAPDRLQPG